ncbi:MAG TPA: hypothetical protein VMR41_02835 [Patescibacteria group bacterium]|nr:hypothetical protein [Patescibacteria group bacterium]
MRNQAGIFLIAIFCLAIVASQKAFASATTSASSANLADQTELSQPVDNRAKVLKQYLSDKNSPLINEADVLIANADKNHIDWRLLVAISGVESTFGQEIPSGSFNAWGYGIYGNNTRYFTSWDDAISTISSDIRTKYMDQWHATNVDEIGQLYAASPTWAVRVENFMNEINAYNQYYASAALPISL